MFVSIVMFGLLNVVGAGIGGWNYEGEVEKLSEGGDLFREKTFSFKNYLDLLSKDDTTLLRLHYIISFNLPINENKLVISYHFLVEPVEYDFFVFNQQLFDYVESEITEVSLGSGNDSYEYETESGLLKQMTLFSGESLFEIEITLPSNWYGSENKTLYIVWGNFKVVKNEIKYEGRREEGNRQLKIGFSETDFARGYDISSGTYKWEFLTDFPVQSAAKRTVRWMLTCLIILIAVISSFIFSFDIVKILEKWKDDDKQTILDEFNKQTILSKPNNQPILNNQNTKVTMKELERFLFYVKVRGFTFSVSTILFIYAVLLYLIGYIHFGAPAVKDYPFICVIAALIFYLTFSQNLV